MTPITFNSAPIMVVLAIGTPISLRAIPVPSTVATVPWKFNSLRISSGVFGVFTINFPSGFNPSVTGTRPIRLESSTSTTSGS